MSGVASTRWNEHLACYFAYASLPPEHRNRECNIRFRSVSMTAKELELDVATVDMIRWASLSFLAHQIHDQPIESFDPLAPSHQRNVLLVLDCISMPADTPAQNISGSTVAPAGSYPCTACRWGAKDDVGPVLYRRTEEGFLETMAVSFLFLPHMMAT